MTEQITDLKKKIEHLFNEEPFFIPQSHNAIDLISNINKEIDKLIKKRDKYITFLGYHEIMKHFDWHCFEPEIVCHSCMNVFVGTVDDFKLAFKGKLNEGGMEVVIREALK